MEQQPPIQNQAQSNGVSEVDLEQKLEQYYAKELSRFVLPTKHAYNCFEGQKENEKALLYLRKHWIVEIGVFIKTFLVSIIPVALLLLLEYYNPQIEGTPILGIFKILVLFFILFAMLHFFVDWMDIHLDIIIVTNKRIIDVNQTRIFNRKISSMPLNEIQDVSGQTKGLLAYFFRYGTLNIETAGAGKIKDLMTRVMRTNGQGDPSSEGNVFEMAYVYKADRVATAILNIRDYYVKRTMGKVEDAAF